MYWPLAIQHARDIGNIVHHSRTDAVPFDVWFKQIGLKPDYRSIYTFGCAVYAYIPSIADGGTRTSKGERARRFIYVGKDDVAKTSARLMDFQIQSLLSPLLLKFLMTQVVYFITVSTKTLIIFISSSSRRRFP